MAFSNHVFCDVWPQLLDDPTILFFSNRLHYDVLSTSQNENLEKKQCFVDVRFSQTLCFAMSDLKKHQKDDVFLTLTPLRMVF